MCGLLLASDEVVDLQHRLTELHSELDSKSAVSLVTYHH